MRRDVWARVGLLGLVFGSWACGATAVVTPRPPVKDPVVAADDAPAAKKAEPVVVAQDVPAAPVSDLVTLVSAPEQRVVAADEATELIVRVRLSAETIPSAERPPINLALVVDTSGSMQGDPIDRARQACATIVRKLKKGDRLSLVTFGSRASVLVPSTVLDDDNVPALEKKIATITASGTTAMAEGLAQGIAEVRKGMLPNGVNRIVLLGDGVPNDQPSTLGYAASAQAHGVPITSLGLGADFDETVMNEIAQRSGGSFHFIDEPQQVVKVFEKEVTRLERVVMKNGWLEITPGPGVVVHRALGLPGSMLGRKLRVNLGQLSEGQTRDVMVHMTVNARPDGASIELADALFHYEDAAQGQGARELTHFVSLKASKSADDVAEGRDPAVAHEATRIKVADLIVRAIALARGSDVKGARKLLVDAEKIARDGAKTFDDDELGKKAGEARELRLTVAKLAPPPQPVWHGSMGGPGGSRPQPPVSMPAPMPRPQALGMRRTHGDAMKTINGL